jgi:hypothetical protein
MDAGVEGVMPALQSGTPFQRELERRFGYVTIMALSRR